MTYYRLMLRQRFAEAFRLKRAWMPVEKIADRCAVSVKTAKKYIRASRKCAGMAGVA